MIRKIGDTPLIELKEKHASGNRIFAKMEGFNPSGSVKDRAASYMMQMAELRGNLHKGKTIIEASSGNMGISFAMLGAMKSYPVKIIMSESMSRERRQMISAYGAELILTDASLGSEGAVRLAKHMHDKNPDKYWFPNQFHNPDNMQSHIDGIATELLQQLTRIDYVVAGMGTSGTLMGIAHAFAEKSPNTKIIAVYPPAGYEIQGIQNQNLDFKSDFFNEKLISDKIYIDKSSAAKACQELAKNHGILAGMSSGAAYYASKRIKPGNIKCNIVTIFPDRGEKYMSMEIFN